MKKIKTIGGPPRYGASDEEKAILDFISYARRLQPGQVKRRSYKKIADDLNARSMFPRIAAKWTPVLVFHADRRNGERRQG